jgi:septum formation protein
VRLVLASSSPRRARLLEEAGYPFETRASRADEAISPASSPAGAAVELAVRKALAIGDAGDAFVLAADTLLDLDGAPLGKPRGAEDARRILRLLSGRGHRVVTGVCLRRAESIRTGLAETRVTFRALEDDEIDAYVATGEPLDKAGAYAIQGGAAAFVERLDGPLDNVVGLPMGLVRALLSEAGYRR